MEARAEAQGDEQAGLPALAHRARNIGLHSGPIPMQPYPRKGSITSHVPRARKRGAMRACMRHLTARLARADWDSGNRRPKTDAAHPALLRTPFTPVSNQRAVLEDREVNHSRKNRQVHENGGRV